MNINTILLFSIIFGEAEKQHGLRSHSTMPQIPLEDDCFAEAVGRI